MADVSQIKLPNGSVYDLIDEKSGYITAEYIENKTDYEIPVSRVGEIVVGETAIGTDSTNFPTSKAVVDYVDERVVQEIAAIDVGVTGIKANGRNLSIENGVVNIPAVGPNQPIGLMTEEYIENIWDELDYTYNQIPTSTSQLNNDSGFITASDIPDWAKAPTKPTYTASEVGALPSSTVVLQIFMVDYNSSTNTANKTYTEIRNAYQRGDLVLLKDTNNTIYQITSINVGYLFTTIQNLTASSSTEGYNAKIKQLKVNSSNTWSTYDYKLPRKTSDLTNDSGYLTASDIASVMTYKGTKANYAALPSTGNTTGDVWHLTDTGAEWAWDGSAWQELGTAIDLSGYVPKVVSSADDVSRITVASTGITLSSSQNDSDYSSSIIVNGEVTISASGRAGTNTLSMNQNTTTIHNLVTPTADKDAANKKYVDDSIGALSIPTKTSDLTNDSGYLTSYTETDPTVPSWAKASSKPSYGLTEISGTDDLRAIEALTGTSGLLKKTAANTWTLDTNTYLTSYTDEKVKQVPLNGTNSFKGLLFSSGTGDSQVVNTVYTTDKLQWNDYDSGPVLYIYNGSKTKHGSLSSSALRLTSLTTNYQGKLQLAAITDTRTYTLPDKTGTIALTSDIPDTSSFLTSETDPVFSASAAAGITATDISNWNGKSSTDEKVKATALTFDDSTHYPIFGNSSGNAETKNYTNAFTIGASSTYNHLTLQLGNANTLGRLQLYRGGGDSNRWTVIAANLATGNRTITLPDKTGTVALTSDIPIVPTKVSDLTNDSGFISSYTETDPIFSASAAGGITATDISNWNGKSDTDEKLKISNISVTSAQTYYPIFGDSGASVATRQYDATGLRYQVSTNYSELMLGYYNPSKQGKITLFNSGYYKTLRPSTLTSSGTILLPDANGTIALTSDIPQVYSSTNTGGYLTMATLPIYDGTVE